MVGIVGILLLGSLAWSAVGALFGAVQSLSSPVSSDRPTPGGAAALIGTATPIVSHRTPTPLPTVTPTPLAAAAPTPTAPAADTPAPTPQPQSSPTPDKTGRAPWVLLPRPAPDSRITPGQVTIEARGRGDSAIATLRLELDGKPLSTTLEQRSETTWRAAATVPVGPGPHTVRATVVDDQNRTGGYHWTFDAGP